MAQMTVDDLHGSTVHDTDGSKIGKVSGVYTDEQTGKAEWVAVHTGLFGSKEALIPIAAGTLGEDGLVVPFDKEKVKNAPHTDPDTELTTQQEAELFTYYGVPYGGDTVTATGGATATSTDRVQDTSGPNTDDSMTRSEERLHVGTESVEAGKARLRKYVVSEQVSQTVPVSHEEVTVTREPITEANRDAAMTGRDLSEEEVEVTLHAERPVVAKETVPVERVRLGTETITEQAKVEESVSKEVIETEGVDPRT